MSASHRISIALPTVAKHIDAALTDTAGLDVPWVLVCQVDGVAQYVSNTQRPDGTALIESLLERWKAGRADIPAHYNPDLKECDHKWVATQAGVSYVDCKCKACGATKRETWD